MSVYSYDLPSQFLYKAYLVEFSFNQNNEQWAADLNGFVFQI